MSPDRQDSQEAAYGRVCDSYQAIDDFRMKLLGLLPVATGTGVFLLLNDNVPVLGPNPAQGQSESLTLVLTAIGAFGAIFTLGLFSYELFGIKKCHYLIRAGQRLEVLLDIQGQFRNRPRNLMGFINEPFASALIYPASLAAWVFLATALRPPPWRWALPLAVFLGGFLLTLFLTEEMKRRDLRRFRAELMRYVDSHAGGRGAATVEDMSAQLHEEDEMVRRALAKVSRAPRMDGQSRNLFRRIQASCCRTCLRVLEKLERQDRHATVRADETADADLESRPEGERSWVTVVDAVGSRPRSGSKWRCRYLPIWQEIAGTVGTALLVEASGLPTPRTAGEVLESGASKPPTQSASELIPHQTDGSSALLGKPGFRSS